MLQELRVTSRRAGARWYGLGPVARPSAVVLLVSGTLSAAGGLWIVGMGESLERAWTGVSGYLAGSGLFSVMCGWMVWRGNVQKAWAFPGGIASLGVVYAGWLLVTVVGGPRGVMDRSSRARGYSLERDGLAERPETRLAQAAREGDVNRIRQILADGAVVDEPSGRRRETALHVAVGRGRVEAVKVLLEYGASPKSQDWAGDTALHRAWDVRIAELLLGAGAEIESRGGGGGTPLHRAAASGSEEVVLLLVRKGANVNARTGNGYSVLHYAAITRKRKLVEALVEAGADASIRTPEGETALDILNRKPKPRSSW